MSKPRIIALYLPQYHPFPENDEWWGKGFTEWTNVARAKPLFKGHYQPRIPADLGFYDLRLPIVREQQAELAREAGVEGFCYWHYWFGNGKQLMAEIIDDVIASGKPNFPFCLGWANHSWFAKNWNTKDSGKKDRMLIEQTFPGDNDIRMHYEYVLKAFKDPRYIKVENKPFFMIFKANDIPENFTSLWNEWAKEDGYDGIYFVGNVDADEDTNDYLRRGFSAVIKDRIKKQREKVSIRMNQSKIAAIRFVFQRCFNSLRKRPDHIFSYEKSIYDYVDEKDDQREDVIPNLIPNFDHSPRSGVHGYIVHGSTPTLFRKHVRMVLEMASKKKNNFVMLRSWNEWGEGNYMEPDLRYGKAYIQALRGEIDNYESSTEL